jgi:hypothetical protein
MGIFVAGAAGAIGQPLISAASPRGAAVGPHTQALPGARCAGGAAAETLAGDAQSGRTCTGLWPGQSPGAPTGVAGTSTAVGSFPARQPWSALARGRDAGYHPGRRHSSRGRLYRVF